MAEEFAGERPGGDAVSNPQRGARQVETEEGPGPEGGVTARVVRDDGNAEAATFIRPTRLASHLGLAHA